MYLEFDLEQRHIDAAVAASKCQDFWRSKQCPFGQVLKEFFDCFAGVAHSAFEITLEDHSVINSFPSNLSLIVNRFDQQLPVYPMHCKVKLNDEMVEYLNEDGRAHLVAV